MRQRAVKMDVFFFGWTVHHRLTASIGNVHCTWRWKKQLIQELAVCLEMWIIEAWELD